MTDENKIPEAPETPGANEFHILPRGYTEAALSIAETLVQYEVDPAFYPRIFKAVRLLLDPEFDDSTTIERLARSLVQTIAADPSGSVQLLRDVLGSAVSYDAFPGAAAAPAPADPYNSPLEPGEAHVVVFVSPEGVVRHAGVFSERTPTVVDGSKTFVACTGYGKTFDEAQANAVRNYRFACADLERIAPLV